MAAQTRADILDAARVLFVRDGYSATSIAGIAKEADVAVQTIYSRLGSKRAILMALVDRIDEEAGLGEIVPEIMRTTDPAQALGLYVGLTRRFQERCGDVIGALFGAVGAEPDIDAFVEEGRHRHRDGAQRVIAHMLRHGDLRDGLGEHEAAALATVATTPEAWRELRVHGGLDWDDAEALVTSTLRTALLGKSRRRQTRSSS
jgi:AcrR family transcriptional regulator